MPPDDPAIAGRSVGPYRLVRLLGRGGMGVVYEARQESPRRAVALKLLLGGPHVDAATRRMFQRECDSLARLKHPSIAAIYASGETTGGQPYIAMELAGGRPLSQALEQIGAPRSRPDVRRRLALLRSIAGAVAYAHQRGVIHRDLKPSNIMVNETDAVGAASGGPAAAAAGLPEIKILDFGLARIVDPDAATQETMARSTTARVEGTLPYMSPEQIRGRQEDADARTDVYALGVILYQTLSGRLPFPVESMPWPEAARVICETPPPPLGAAKGGVRIDRDLVVIVFKALEKDPARRYATVAALDEDIGRYLEGQTILARPPSAAYQMRRLLTRHKAAFAAAALAAVGLAALAVVMTTQARRLARERDRAGREAATAQQVTAFLTGLFNVSDPDEARGNTVTARSILDRGVASIDHDLAGQPEIRASLLFTLSQVYENLGLWKAASSLAEQSFDIRRRLLGDEHPVTLDSLEALAAIDHNLDRWPESERKYEQVLAVRRRTLGPEHPATLGAIEGLAFTYLAEGRLPEAERLEREVLEARRRVLGEENRDTIQSMMRLGDTLRAESKFPEAETWLARAAAGYDKLLGPDAYATLAARGYLAKVIADQGRYAEAEPLFREILGRMDRVLGADHPQRIELLSQLGELYDLQEHYPESEAIHREVLEWRRRVLGPDHHATRNSMNNLANALSMQGQYAEAETLLKETLAGDIRLAGPDHPDTTRVRYNLACTAALRGDRREALHWLEEAVTHGYNRPKKLLADDDLKSLRAEPRFRAAVAKAQANADRAHNPAATPPPTQP